MKTGNRIFQRRVEPCNISLSTLNKIIAEVHDLNKTAKAYQLKHEQTVPANSNLSIDDATKYIDDYMKVIVGVWASNGDYTAFRNPSSLSQDDLHDVITMIQIDNHTDFNRPMGRAPLHELTVTFDCTSPAAFDLSINPSYQTPNKSEITVLGVDQTWVEGSKNRLNACLGSKNSFYKVIHASATYDISLWFLYIPAVISYLSMVDGTLKALVEKFSLGLQVLMYITILVVSLILFRMAFGFVRWLFPYIEVIGHSNRKTLSIRTIGVSLALLIWAGAFYDVVKFAILTLLISDQSN